MDSFHTDFDFFLICLKTGNFGQRFFLKQNSGNHEEVKYVALSAMYLKQLSDCSRSDSDEYTESTMKLVQKQMSFGKKKVIKSHEVSPLSAGRYLISFQY